eukprot:Lithocolla_globosa_v1_NODE_2986_length_1804_cov_12.332190.p3 type:complete len:103 gc:universal NODE_2986_length_1804_cov_12.332190:1193-1501(+)
MKRLFGRFKRIICLFVSKTSCHQVSQMFFEASKDQDVIIFDCWNFPIKKTSRSQVFGSMGMSDRFFGLDGRPIFLQQHDHEATENRLVGFRDLPLLVPWHVL